MGCAFNVLDGLPVRLIANRVVYLPISRIAGPVAGRTSRLAARRPLAFRGKALVPVNGLKPNLSGQRSVRDSSE